MVNRPLNELYVGCAKVIIQRVKVDIRDINTALSAENIRVERESVNQTSVTYRAIFRGQVSSIEIMKDEARTEIGWWLSDYIRNVVSDLTKRLCYP
jgi:transcription antitermination factor NusA-like protein